MSVSRTWLLVAALVIAALLAATVVTADEWETSAYKGWATASVAIEGIADKNLSAELRAGLALALNKGILGRNRPTFYPHVLTEDVQRARLFLARRGYPYAEVQPRLSGDARKESVAVVLEVTLGESVTVGSVDIRGLSDELRQKTHKQFAVKQGTRFVDDDVRRTEVDVREQLLKLGYAKAAVASSSQWIDRTHVAVKFDIEPGRVYYFGDVVVEGADEDLVPLIRKTTQTRRGRQYRPKLVDDTHRDLRVLDLFRQVRLDVKEAAADTLDVIIRVVMRDPRTVETLVSYFNDERLNVGAIWQHRNLFKRGRGLRASGRASIFLQEIGASVWWPGVFFARDRVVLGSSARRENEEAFEAVSVGGDLSLRYTHSFQTTSRYGVEVRDITVDEKVPDPDTDLQDGLTTIFFAAFDRNASNDWINPTEGTVLRLRLRWAPGGVVSDNEFVLSDVSGIWYMPVGGASVIALRGALGAARPYGKSTDLLATERFFSGGANTMRGFSRRRLGPKNAANDPVGGEARIELGVEARFPLVWRIAGALFMDTGQVWRKYDEFAFDEIEVAVGPGVWLTTPVGPLRFDYAYRLTNFDDSEPRYKFHFSIGPAF